MSTFGIMLTEALLETFFKTLLCDVTYFSSENFFTLKCKEIVIIVE